MGEAFLLWRYDRIRSVKKGKAKANQQKKTGTLGCAGLFVYLMCSCFMNRIMS